MISVLPWLDKFACGIPNAIPTHCPRPKQSVNHAELLTPNWSPGPRWSV